MSMQSDSGRLARVLMKHARDAFVGREAIGAQWRELRYLGPPDYEEACRESDALAELLDGLGVEVLWASAGDTGLDSIYVRDASVLADRGAIRCSMGKEARRSEPEALGAEYKGLGVPVLGAIGGAGRLEGGDVTWIGPRALAVGRGYRTNDEGIRQLAELLADAVEEIVTVPLPHWRGPSDVFHLMSVISPLAPDLALVYSPLLPVPFRESLLDRGIDLVEVPDEEFDSMGCNVLALGPRRCLMLSGHPVTRERMERHGVEVVEFSGKEICLKGGGGPTCLTRPLVRG